MKYALMYIIRNKFKSFLIYIAFFLCISVMITSTILLDTISNINNIQREYQNTPYNIIIKNSSKYEYDKVKNDKSIDNIGTESFLGVSNDSNYLYQVMATDENNLLSTTKFIKGSSFNDENDIVLEKWVLDYLGLKHNLNQKIDIVYKDNSGNFKKEKCNLSGIINDIPINKNIGLKVVYKDIKWFKPKKFNVKIKYKKGTNLYSELNKYQKQYNIDKNNITINASSEQELNEILSNGLDYTNIIKNITFSFLCIFIVFSIINMTIKERIKLYSLFKAIGAKGTLIFKMIFYELTLLFALSIPTSMIISYIFVNSIIKKIEFINYKDIYLHGKIANFELIINYNQIFVNLIILLLFVFLLSILFSLKLKKINIIDGVYENDIFNKIKYSTNKTYINFINKDINIILIMVITISMLSSYYLMVNFDDYLNKEQGKMMIWDMYSYSDIKLVSTDKNLDNAISLSDYKKIYKLNGINEIDFCKMIPGKIIFNEKWTINNKYFNNLNNDSKESYWKEYLGKNNELGKTIIKGSIRGYSDSAIKKLNYFKTSGNFSIKKLKEKNNAILVIPKTDENNFKNLQHGKSVLDVDIGDTVEIFTPKSHIIDENYYNINDGLEKYDLNSYNIVGIAYGSYFENSRERTNPTINLIIPDERFSEKYNIYDYKALNIYAEKNIDIDNLYSKVDNIFLGKKHILSRNVNSEITQINQINSRKKIFNISVLSILFLAAVFCSINNTSSLFEVNKKYILLIRYLGASKKKIRKFLVYEWIFISVVILIMTFFMSTLSQNYIYFLKGLSYEGIKNSYNCYKFIKVSLFNSFVILIVLFYKNYKTT